MESNEDQLTCLPKITVEDVMNFEGKDLDRLLEDIQSRIAKNRMQIEQCLEEF